MNSQRTIVCWLLLVVGCAAPQRPAEPPREGPLAEMNLAFRERYKKAKLETLARGGPVIIVSGNDLVLIRNGRQTTVPCIGNRFHTLKAASHVPLAVFVMIHPWGDGPVSEDRLAGLREYRALVAAARPHIKTLGYDEPTRVRQEKLLDDGVAFLDRVLASKTASPAELEAYTRSQGPAVLAAVSDAAATQLDAMHVIVSDWRRQMTDEGWTRLQVVISGGPMPRLGNIATQYFARLLNEPGEGLRIYYAEGRWEQEKALDLLATGNLDSAVAVGFFNDKMRMHRDILADAAKVHVERLLGK